MSKQVLEHGTGVLYTDGDCRCSECVEWFKLFERKVVDYDGIPSLSPPKRVKRRIKPYADPHRPIMTKPTAGPAHGSQWGYDRMKCRCRLCKTWKVEYRHKRMDTYGKPRNV